MRCHLFNLLADPTNSAYDAPRLAGELGRWRVAIGLAVAFCGWTRDASAAAREKPVQGPASTAGGKGRSRGNGAHEGRKGPSRGVEKEKASLEQMVLESYAVRQETDDGGSKPKGESRLKGRASNDEPSSDEPEEREPTEPASKRRFPHSGFIFAPRIGMQDCTGKICSRSHKAAPGPRFDLFVGRNVGGIFDVGIAAGWGMLFAPSSVGKNALELFNVDLDRYDAFARIASPLFRFDARELGVHRARLSSARIGAHVRLHFNPKGRFLGYIGTGLGYSLFRADYITPPGRLRVEVHGFDIPIEGGAAIQVHKHVAVGLEGAYLWAHYLVGSITHPAQKSVAPLSLLQASVVGPAANLKQELPDVWSLGVVIRVRI